jgi:hypothetical protein
MRGRLLVTGLASVLLFLLAGADAGAAVCGRAVGSGGPSRGALTLLKKPSTLIIPFGKETGGQELVLIFKVSGCTLPPRRAPHVEALPDDEAPGSFNTVLDPRTFGRQRVADDRLNVRIPVDPKRVKPGSYGAIIQVSADYLTPALTPVTVSRSENNWLWPLFLGAGGGLVGLLLSLLTKAAAGSTLRTDRWRLVAVVVVSMGAGVVAGLVSYGNQDIWRLSENWVATAAAGVTAATTGSALAVLGVVFVDTVRDPTATVTQMFSSGAGGGGAKAG